MSVNRIGFGPNTSAWTGVPITLHTGQTYPIPSGQYLINLGAYTAVQWYDPVSQIWRPYQTPTNSDTITVSSDGFNYRLVNISGTVAGAYVTNGGSGYPNGIYPASSTTQTQSNYVIATASAAGAQSSLIGTIAKFNVVVGGAVSTTVTVTAGGSNYTRPPTLIFQDPPAGGVRASGYVSALSSGAISTVVITNQGAGYTTAPTITVVPHALDTTAAGAVLTATIDTTNFSGRVTAVTLAEGGSAYAAVPTISFTSSAGSSAAATAVACMSCTSVSSVSGGSANQTANTGAFWIVNSALAPSKTNAPLNPAVEGSLFTPRIGFGTLQDNGSGTFTGATVTDGGLFQMIGSTTTSTRLVGLSQWTTAAPTASATGTVNLGGNIDTAVLIPI
jgi:hypothetical protein